MSRQRGTGLLDSISNEAGRAITDIRQRLFEEAWFGRVVTNTSVERNYVSEKVVRTSLFGHEINRESVVASERSHDITKNFKDFWGRSPAGKEQPEHEGPGESAIDRVPDDQFDRDR